MGNVTTLKTIDSSVISLIILIFIFFSSYNRTDRLFREHKLFKLLILINIYLIIVDYLGWAFNGLPGEAYKALNTSFNCLLYISAPAAPMIWILYISYQVSHDDTRQRLLKRLLAVLFAANAAISIVSLFTGWYFYVDPHNVYHRGDLFFLYIMFNYSLIVYSIVHVVKNRKTIEKRYFLSLLLFFVPPTTGTLLQTFVYGVSYNWVGMALSVLIIYFNIQNRGLNTDYLTGAYNKRQLDSYTQARARSGAYESTFSAIVFDIDNMKGINDTLGHDAGDSALKDTVEIVRQNIRENDFIARVGGDEFVVILDIQKDEELEKARRRIEEGVREFNRAGARPYEISFSSGQAVYDAKSGMKPDDFFKMIDALMYREKKEKKKNREE